MSYLQEAKTHPFYRNEKFGDNAAAELIRKGLSHIDSLVAMSSRSDPRRQEHKAQLEMLESIFGDYLTSEEKAKVREAHTNLR